jgi:hypothetical protein
VSASLWGNIRRGRYRWLLRLAVVLVAGVAALVYLISQRSRRVLTIENRSGQPIATLRVTLAGQTSSYQDVRVGVRVTVPQGENADDRFTLEGRLADGTMLRGRGVLGKGAALVVLPGGQVVVPQRDGSPR